MGPLRLLWAVTSICASVGLTASMFGCKAQEGSRAATADAPFMSKTVAAPPQALVTDALPADKTGGFDGRRAYEHVAKQVALGPRPSGSPAIVRLQNYLDGELKSYGCAVDVDSFGADTPAGRLQMKNFLVKIPGEKPGIVLLGTHYDTKRLENFVGADDAGSSTAVMLELARLLCARPKGKYAVWIAFFDGEEAVNLEWKDPDNCYGSRQMAAKLAVSGELAKVKAFLLADIVGGKSSHFRREASSTKWLASLVWDTAKRLGYGNIFLDQDVNSISDDHDSFLARKVPSADVIDLDSEEINYWHTPGDAMDKISAKTLGVVGHVFLESVAELQKK
jgi:glutaminyl-peptide cyclotransferase